MSAVTNAPAVVNIEGAKRLEKSAKLAAALLPNIVAAAEALEVARTLGKSDQELLGELAQIAKAERPKMLAIELINKGMGTQEIAKQVGLTQGRVSQIRKELSPKFRRAAELILDFLGDHNAPEHVWNALDMIASPAAKRMFAKIATEGEQLT